MKLFEKHRYAPPITDGLDVETLLARAKASQEPRDAHAYLVKAEEMAPADIRPARELLMRGRLHERDPRNLDYGIIKSYVLHVFEHPDMHKREEVRRCAREIFDDPRLQKCLSLCSDREAFLRDYLDELCGQYMRLFIAGDSSHTRAVFGFAMNNRMHKFLAIPAHDTISGILSSADLSEEEKSMLAGAFYRAFSAYVNGQTGPIDAKLGDALARVSR